MWNPDEERYEWWYNGPQARFAISRDGEHWEQPSLGLYEWNGSKDNNIACDPNGPGLYHIVRDERDPDPSRRYKALFNGRGRGGAISPDGFAWTPLTSSFIPSQDESQFVYDPYTEQFLALVKQPTEWGRSVWLATSRDFDHFTAPELIFHADETDWENCRQRVRTIIDDPAYITPPIIDDEDYHAEIYNMAVMPYQGLYIGFPTVFNPIGAIPPPATNFTRINQIEMAVSRDLHTYDRVADRTPFIGIEPLGWGKLRHQPTPHGRCAAGARRRRRFGLTTTPSAYRAAWTCTNASTAARSCSDSGWASATSPTRVRSAWPSWRPTASSPSTATKSPPSSPSPSTGAARTSTSMPTPAGGNLRRNPRRRDRQPPP